MEILEKPQILCQKSQDNIIYSYKLSMNKMVFLKITLDKIIGIL